MPNTAFQREMPRNESVRDYRPSAQETRSLQAQIAALAKEPTEIPCIVGGEEVFSGQVTEWRMPHDQSKVLSRWHGATPEIMARAIETSQEAWRDWSETPPHLRVAIFEKAADLLAGRWRDRVNAATMLGQSKTCFQAEIDAACELIDFWRFNAYFALHRVYSDQPQSSPGTWNYLDHRPLEGFVFAVTPFNFTSIGGNLPTAPAIMGNVAIWKPSHAAIQSNYYVMKVLQEAGLPPGVINFVPGNRDVVTDSVLESPHYAGLHFTGSTQVFHLF